MKTAPPSILEGPENIPTMARHRQLSSMCLAPLPLLLSPDPGSSTHSDVHLCVQHCKGSDLGFRKLSLPNVNMSDWLSSLNTEP